MHNAAGGLGPLLFCVRKCYIKVEIAIVLRYKKEGDSVSRWRNAGGRNKTHGQVEEVPRIDAFEAGTVGGWGHLFAYADKRPLRMLECCRDITYAPDRDIETVEIWHPKAGWSQTLELSRKRNGFGGSQAFCLCPACGERRRYLYLTGATFLCRGCSGLNYKSQQETRSDCMYYYHKGMDLVEKHLEPPPFHIDGFGFNRWIPERPRYMHRTTYARYLRRFAKYQDQHQRRQMEDMARLLRIFK